MEQESFEDEEVAAVLNEHFVSIKVDREERPDIDTIYMAVCQALTGHGGWPLTVFLTPDKKPFYAGTYFPKKSRHGMPGLMDILHSISQAWQTNRKALLESGEKITEVLNNRLFAQTRTKLAPDVLEKAYSYFSDAFDPQYGGFGSAPKFPIPHNLLFLLRYWKMTGEQKALEMVEKTLEGMYRGGIYDHIGFGFARYSTDRKWLVPHFEKMLYDNALLATIYGEAYQATKKPFYAKVAEEIFAYVLRDMISPEGAFYSAEDADSEGEEGKFYVWTPEEVREVLGSDLGKRFCTTYDITPQGNFEGKSIPNLIKSGSAEGYEDAKRKLFAKRAQRIHPYKDDKILTAWNGLMVAALAFNSRALGKPEYARAAERAVEFIMQRLRRKDGRLLARYRDGEAAYPAYVDDYAFLIWGLIELYQATFKPVYLEKALELNRDMLQYFWDEEQGGLYQYGNDAEELLTRPKEIYDGAIPSGNSVATLNFLRLAQLTGDPALSAKAQAQFELFGGKVNASPAGHTFFLMAVYFDRAAAGEVTIVGDPSQADTKEMLKFINTSFLPEMVLIVKQPGQEAEKLARLLPVQAERKAMEGKATAYVCKNFSCQKPTTELGKLAELLGIERRLV